jgi:hypothetical protein
MKLDYEQTERYTELQQAIDDVVALYADGEATWQDIEYAEQNLQNYIDTYIAEIADTHIAEGFWY